MANITGRLRAIEESRADGRIVVKLDLPTNLNAWDVVDLKDNPYRLLPLSIDDRELEAVLIDFFTPADGIMRLVIEPRTKVIKAMLAVGTPNLDRFRRREWR